ncbi:hypothetical protein INT47_004775 [Mucor saturninus]|uniref:Importin N-terminal domain-containing protein n=1 Tax=Mucor saturninus TaxID=64648 RepID=A0A8H7R1N6_9FUNG|nr:hypothetical protein INT47_004775 [Mucor saturninus]
MSTWQPQQQGLRELVVLLRDAANPYNKEQSLINIRLQSFHTFPDYNAYLVYILVQMKEEAMDTRMIAGLQLKNSIKDHFNTIPLNVLEYVKQSCIQLLFQPDLSPINKTVSAVIAAIIGRGQVHNWPQVLMILIEKLTDTQTPLVLEISLDTLVMICEDVAPELDSEIEGIRPLGLMIPHLLSLYSNTDPRLRSQAINATSQFVLLKSVSFTEHLQHILTAVYHPLVMGDPTTRQELGRMMTLLLEAYPDAMEPYLLVAIEYMLNAMEDGMTVTATDFWITYAHQTKYKPQLEPYLPRLVVQLLNNMVYSSSDLIDLKQVAKHKEEGEIRPRYFSTTQHQSDHPTAASKKKKTTTEDELSDLEEESESEESDSDEDDNTSSCSSSSSSSSSASSIQHGVEGEDYEDGEDAEFYARDSPRQCSASALEMLSVTFGDTMATILLDRLVHHTLVHDTWLVRESGILAFGAAAEGGVHVMYDHLPQLLPYVLKSMSNPQPLVRSISCWAVSRFSNWLVREHNKATSFFFEPVLFGLLNRLLDSDSRVQESACTAFIVLTETAAKTTIPYIHPILTHTNRAFSIYGRKNRLLLYDAVGTLAAAVKSHLNQPPFICLLMPPLISKWNQLSDKDTDLFPLLECLSTITAALGKGFIQYVDPVLSRCVKLVLSTLQEQMLADQHPEEMMPPNVDFLIAALDLLSGIVQGLGSAIEPLIAQTNPPLLALLCKCIHDPVSEVLQSTFALLGDIAMASFNLLEPYMHTIFSEMIGILHNRHYMIPISVYNNVLWALGEMVLRWDARQVQRYIPSLMEVLLPLLVHGHVPASIHENAMIALGRLGLASPVHVAPYLSQFIKPWLEKSLSVREGDEKETAFRGLCAVINLNAQDAHSELGLLLVAMATWRNPAPPLAMEIQHVVKGFHGVLTQDQWEQAYDQLDPEAQNQILKILAR